MFVDRLQNIVKGIKKIGETDDLKHLHWNAWDKACFSCNAEFYDRKKLAKETISNKALKEIAHEIATNLRYDGFKAELPSMVYVFWQENSIRSKSECKWIASPRPWQTSDQKIWRNERLWQV